MEHQETTRSGRIAAELRQRIEAGALAPGDRLPSTREITRQWGVAMATASRVLAELRDDGLVRVVPGVGTVVAGRPGSVAPAPAVPARQAQAPEPSPALRKRPPEQPLTLERIVAAAVAVADAEGLAAASMRRVAAELGAAPMSLYRYVTDKDDLVLRMMETVFAAAALPADPPDGWRDRLALSARTLWALFRRHPWLAPALSVTRPQLVRNALHFTEWNLGALDGSGLDFRTLFTTHLTLFNYVRGTAVNVEPENEAEALTGMDSDAWMDTQGPALLGILATGDYPQFERLAADGYELDLDELFEFGLQRLLDGIAVLLGETPGLPPVRTPGP